MLSNDFDRKFYGVYPGKCVDSNDPEDRGRIKLQVPQILGTAVTTWVPSVGGAIAQYNYPYATFTSTQTQTVSAANTATIATFNVEEDSNKISLVNNTRLTVAETGDYFLQFSGQLAKSGSNSAQADIWVRKNGVDLPRSNSRLTFSGTPNEVLASVAFIVDLDANDYIEIAFSSADSGVALTAHNTLTSPTRPAIPSIIATLNLVGKYKPKAGTSVWVTFIGGDPNYPVWTGAL